MKYIRLLIGTILITILLLIMVYSSQKHNDNDPDIQYILENFEKYNNTKVSFTGEIIKINKNRQEITTKLQEPPYILLNVTINNLETNSQPRDIIEILGILDSPQHIIAEKILISERWKYDLIYIRSLPAIPFALYLFLRTWRFNTKTLRFERRKKKDA